MHRLLKGARIILGTILVLFIGFSVYLYVDAYPFAKFRTTQDPIYATERLDLSGLKDLKASGSNAPLFAQLQQHLSDVKSKKIICDVREGEYTYLKGIPLRYFGYHYQHPELRHFLRRLFYTGTFQAHSKGLRGEEAEANAYGFHYVRLPIGSRYVTPDEDVDHFVAFIESIAEDTWIHFHCDKGKGRTSMSLVMYDIMKNAPGVSLKDIVKRQHLLGSEDLGDLTPWQGGSYSKEMLTKRKRFIEEFYAFICQRKASGLQKWSAWKASLKGS